MASRLDSKSRSLDFVRVASSETLSAEEFETWVPPKVALDSTLLPYGNRAHEIIYNRLKTGSILAAARTTYNQKTKKTYYLKKIPNELWEYSEIWESYNTFWKIGDTNIEKPSQRLHGGEYSDEIKLRLEGVRLDPAAVGDLSNGLSQTAQVPTQTTVNQLAEITLRNRGGRPRNDYWEDMWAEIGRQLSAGELRPGKQSDIETAMMTWIELRGFSASESTVRIRAVKLAKALGMKAEN